ncbi:MAG: serine/threonine-protein kinase [Phycisphaerales bacterium]
MIDEPTIVSGDGSGTGPDQRSMTPAPPGLDATIVDAGTLAGDSGSATVGNPFRPRSTKLSSGATIGPYRIARVLGEGGFGVVYQAEQERPVKRTVALKLVKPGMATEDVLARFDAERQALARMEHPCVAKVLDAGITEDDRPYFAMEFVRGEPMVSLCDREQVGVRERVEAFIRVCEAIQHAHAKGVVHRDLKPANILCSRADDGQVAPKVIDFGIAKALGERLGETTLHTAGGLMIGTPDYMSPEQADGADIDTRTDVYALGATLYQLLAGLLPFDPEALRGGGYGQMRTMLVEQMPPRPSERLRACERADPKQAASIAALRGTTVPALVRALRDDLDWICLKCLAKDREQRYDSPGSLARDLQRHLDGLPVSAGPPSRAYLMRKFVVRHRWGVGVAAVVAALVVASAVTFAKLYRETDLLFQDAERQRTRAEATLGAFQEALKGVDPGRDGKAEMRALDFLSRVEGKLDESLAEQPDALASLRTALGEVWLNFAEGVGAERLLHGALEYRRAAARPNDAASMVALGDALHNYGRALYLLKDFAAAEKTYQEALSVRRAIHPGDHASTALTLQHLASVARERDDLLGADRLLTESIDMWTRMGGSSLERARAINNRGVLRERQRDLYAAELDYAAALNVASSALPADDIQIGRMHANLGRVRSLMAHHDDAIPELEQALEIKIKRLGEENVQTHAGARELAEALEAAGRPVPDKVEALRRKAVPR